MDLNVCGGAYSIKAPISVQESVNLYLEVESLGAQEQINLRRFPGLKLFSSPVNGSIRGMWTMAKVLYAVSGEALFSIDSSGTATNLGTISGTSQVGMADDGSNLVIVNGVKGYVYNGSTLAEITDTDFVPASKVYFLDTYFILQRTDTQQFFISESGSATSYLATDFATKEAQPGDIVAVHVANRDVYLRGAKTSETWRNTGNPDFPFERQEGTFQERGALGLHSPIEMDNATFFLGDDRVVYSQAAYQAERISHHAIETWLTAQSQSDIDAANGMTITHEGHYWYILTFPKGTWVYDATTSKAMGSFEWFQLRSWERENWRVKAVQTAYGKTYCGDDQGLIYELDPDTLNENGQRQIKRRVTPYYHNDRKPVSFHRLELGFEQGVATAAVPNPQVFLEISRDWGRTWSSRRARSLGQAGQYTQKAVWRRNGEARGHVFRWTITDDVEVTITGGYGEAGVGSG